MSKLHEIIVVRRAEPEDERPHGGVWKIAHADFMTAMMAFFLIMWLINQADPSTIQSVANYFNPVNLAQSVTDVKGLEDNPARAATTDRREVDDGKKTGGPAAYAKKPRFEEGALFQDPYAILARISDEADVAQHDALGADVMVGESDKPGIRGGDVPRDPFDPVYWQVQPMREVRGEGETRPGTMAASEQGELNVRTRSRLREDAASQKQVAESVVVGESGAQVEVENVDRVKAEAANAAADAVAQGVSPELAKLVERLQTQLASHGGAATSPKVEVRRVEGGTMISLTDNLGYSMFAIGSAEPDGRVVKAMETIGKSLATHKGNIVVRGHTDGRPFRSKDYDNWRLSHARAQMALYMLVRGGVPETRFARVEGHADRDLKVKGDPKADANRRIEIFIQE